MSATDAKTLSAWRALVQAAQHVTEGRDCTDPEKRRELLEAAAMDAKMALGLLAEVQPTTVDATGPVRLGPAVAAYWRGFRAFERRVAAGEADDALDAERERLGDEWRRLSLADVDAIRALMTARGGVG